MAATPSATGCVGMKDAVLKRSWSLIPWCQRTAAEQRQGVAVPESLQGDPESALQEVWKVKVWEHPNLSVDNTILQDGVMD